MSEVGVVVDTNVLASLYQIDADCDLIELLVGAFGTTGYADHRQLGIMNYCTQLPKFLRDHGIADEEVALFIMGYKGKASLDRVKNDPADIKFLLFAVRNPSTTVLTCDRSLLVLCASHSLPHFCFKAAIHKVDSDVGGLFDQDDYATEEMFNAVGTHPFFHYANQKHCATCDPERRCTTRSRPPSARGG